MAAHERKLTRQSLIYLALTRILEWTVDWANPRSTAHSNPRSVIRSTTHQE